MRSERATLMSLRDVVSEMTPNSVLSRMGIVTLTAWSVALHMYGNGATVSGNVLARVAVTLAATAPTFITLAISARWIIPRCHDAARVTASLATFFIASVLRAVVLQVMLLHFGMRSPGNETTVARIVGGTTLMTLALVVVSFVASIYQESRARNEMLAVERERLSVALADSGQLMSAQQATTVDRIQQMLDRELDTLPLDSADDALRALSTIASGIVRPMSHELARNVPSWQLPDADSARFTWAGIWRHVDLDSATRPVILTIWTVGSAAGFGSMFFPPRTTMLMLAIGLPLIPISLLTVRRLLGPPLQRLGPRWRAVGITIALLLAATPSAIVFALLAEPGPYEYLYSHAALVVLPFTGWLVAIATASMRELDAVNRQLVEVNEQLRWAVARSRMLQWHRQRQLSRALHGPVQSALHASMHRIRATLGPDAAPADVVGRERDWLQSTVVRLLTASDDVVDIDRELREIVQAWEGVASISIDAPATLTCAINTDQACAGILGDLAQEAVSNAIRHGKARTVAISLSSGTADRIRLAVSNDGVAANAEGGIGLGTEQLDDCSIEWRRWRSADGMHLTAVVPLVAG